MPGVSICTSVPEKLYLERYEYDDGNRYYKVSKSDSSAKQAVVTYHHKAMKSARTAVSPARLRRPARPCLAPLEGAWTTTADDVPNTRTERTSKYALS